MNCTYANKGMCILPQGTVSPCCSIGGPDLHKFQSIEQFHNDKVFVDVRNYNKNNDVLSSSWCDVCKFHEEKNQVSLRNRINNNPIQDTTDDSVLRLLDISFGNTCNLDCVMCNSYYSSKWASQHSNNKELGQIIGNDSLTETSSNTLGYDQIDQIINSAGTLERIIIKGGEPLYDKKAMYFLENLKKVNSTAKIHMVTNLTMLDDKRLNLIKQFNDINLIASIDGLRDTYKWIRGYDWEKIENNVDKCIDNGIKISVQFTITAYNVENLESTYQHYKNKGLSVNFIFTNEPWTHYSNVGKQRLESIKENLTAPVNLEIMDPMDTNAFEKYTHIMNVHRGFKFEEIQNVL